MRIGKFQIFFYKYHWLQIYGCPVKSKKILFITIYWQAHPTDIDKEQQFPLGTPLVKDGRTYRYWRANTKIHKGRWVSFHS